MAPGQDQLRMWSGWGPEEPRAWRSKLTGDTNTVLFPPLPRWSPQELSPGLRAGAGQGTSEDNMADMVTLPDAGGCGDADPSTWQAPTGT